MHRSHIQRGEEGREGKEEERGARGTRLASRARARREFAAARSLIAGVIGSIDSRVQWPPSIRRQKLDEKDQYTRSLMREVSNERAAERAIQNATGAPKKSRAVSRIDRDLIERLNARLRGRNAARSSSH